MSGDTGEARTAEALVEEVASTQPGTTTIVQLSANSPSSFLFKRDKSGASSWEIKHYYPTRDAEECIDRVIELDRKLLDKFENKT